MRNEPSTKYRYNEVNGNTSIKRLTCNGIHDNFPNYWMNNKYIHRKATNILKCFIAPSLHQPAQTKIE